MLKKLKNKILKWLGVPDDLQYQLQKLNNWSMENERRRHLLHNSVDNWGRKIIANGNKLTQLLKKEHALQRHFGYKYETYFTTEPCACPKKEVEHYKIILPENSPQGGSPPWRTLSSLKDLVPPENTPVVDNVVGV